MEPQIIGIIGIIVALVLILLGVHIAIALGVAGFAGLVILSNVNSALLITVHTFYTSASTYSFTVLPLFIIMGHFAASAGITEKAFVFASRWLSNLRAGLYLVTIGACGLFAAVTGSSAACTAAVGKTVLPEMIKLGYDKRMSLASVAASGTLGVLIPPSIYLVVYGIIVEEPIGSLLLAGVIPGILTVLVYMLGMSTLIRLRPHLAPPGAKYTWKERFESVPGIWGIALLFAIVIGGIYSGVFTPTEAGAWGAFAAIALMAARVKKKFRSEALKAGQEAVVTTAMIFFIIITAIVFTRFLTLAGIVEGVLAFMVEGGFSPLIALAMFIGISFILGMFMSAAAALLLVAPVAHAVLIPLGFDGIWLGVIMVIMFEVANITPPVGITVFVAKSLVPEVPLEDIFRAITPFLLMQMVILAILIAFPQIALWLPNMALGT